MKTVLQITVYESESGGTLRLDFGRTGNYQKNCDVLYAGLIDGFKSPAPKSYLELFGLLSSVVESIKMQRPDLAAQIRAQVIDYQKKNPQP